MYVRAVGAVGWTDLGAANLSPFAADADAPASAIVAASPVASVPVGGAIDRQLEKADAIRLAYGGKGVDVQLVPSTAGFKMPSSVFSAALATLTAGATACAIRIGSILCPVRFDTDGLLTNALVPGTTYELIVEGERRVVNGQVVGQDCGSPTTRRFRCLCCATINR